MMPFVDYSSPFKIILPHSRYLCKPLWSQTFWVYWPWDLVPTPQWLEYPVLGHPRAASLVQFFTFCTIMTAYYITPQILLWNLQASVVRPHLKKNRGEKLSKWSFHSNFFLTTKTYLVDFRRKRRELTPLGSRCDEEKKDVQVKFFRGWTPASILNGVWTLPLF